MTRVIIAQLPVSNNIAELPGLGLECHRALVQPCTATQQRATGLWSSPAPQLNREPQVSGEPQGSSPALHCYSADSATELWS